MSEFQASNFKKENGGTPDLLGKTELTSPYFFVPPSGDTASRPASCAAGTLRFNTDIGTLEIFRGNTIGWEQIQKREGQYLGGGTGSNAGTGTRMLLAGGRSSPPAFTNHIEYLTIPTLGNTQEFGDLTRTSGNQAQTGAGSRTRGVWAGGQTSSPVIFDNTIDFVTFSSTGNASNFGDLSNRVIGNSQLSNNIRGLSFSGNADPANISQIDAITMAAESNAFDFGDLSQYRNAMGACASTTRGLMVAGTVAPARVNTIEFVTIMSTGDSQDFGDLAVTTNAGNTQAYNTICASNATRAIVFNGRDSNNNSTNIIQFITIATTGNSVDFGNVTSGYNQMGGSSQTRAVIASGVGDPGSTQNIIEFVEIATTGDATDFGDCTARDENLGACSNGHGGIG